MSKNNEKMKKENKAGKPKKSSTLAAKGGIYAFIVSVIVLAILVIVNVLTAVLPATWTSIDISSSQLYSITSNTKVVVNALEDDITIYWIVQADEEDSVIENLLEKYDSLSDHITVVKKNPDVYPTFAEQYTDEDVSNNSLVVECGDTYRYIAYDDIYTTEINYTTYSYEYYFDGESLITSAIDYVTSDDLPQVYMLEGHGEGELSDLLTEQIGKENMELTSFSILTEGEIPEDADCVLIYAPSTDISDEEAEILIEYAENGGKLLVIAGPSSDDDLDVLYSVLENYGVTAAEGVVVESDSSYYAFQSPVTLLPTIQSSDITDPLIEESYYIIMPMSTGLTISDDAENVTELLSTSDTAFSKIDGYSMTTYEQEEDDIEGPFSLAVSITTDGEGEIIWFASSYFLSDTYNSYSSGANLDVAMNALSELVGDTESVSIRSKSISYSYLTISESTSSALELIMIGLIPAVFLVVGIVVLVRRRVKKYD